jgi:hypothetical protein
MTKKQQQIDPREPEPILWNAISGVRCQFCGQTFLDDGSMNVDASFADHMANVHPNQQVSLLTNKQASVNPGTNQDTGQEQPTPPEVPSEQDGGNEPPPGTLVTSDQWPAFYQKYRLRADKEGITIPELLVGETQKEFDERFGGFPEKSGEDDK